MCRPGRRAPMRRMSTGRPLLREIGIIGGWLAIAAALAGCTAIPADVDGTLDKARDGQIRVGITHNPPWTDTTDPSDPAGVEVRLVEEFAETLDATVVWTVDSEANLAERLHDHASTWPSAGSPTTPLGREGGDDRPIRRRDDRGRDEEARDAHRSGENRFLTTLETFLLERGDAR